MFRSPAKLIAVALATLATLVSTWQPVRAEPLVFANYYVWYQDNTSPDLNKIWGNWDQMETGDPPPSRDAPRFPGIWQPLLGWYDSDGLNYAKWHVDLAVAAGIDAFLVDWWGSHLQLDQTADRSIIKACEERGLKFALLDERAQFHSDFDAYKQMLTAALLKYRQSPAYLHLDGKPVVYLYQIPFSPKLIPADFTALKTHVESQVGPVFWIIDKIAHNPGAPTPDQIKKIPAEWLATPGIDSFGFYSTFASGIPESEYANLVGKFTYLTQLAHGAGKKMLLPVHPGYDNPTQDGTSLIPSNNGQTLRDYLRAATEAGADFVMVTSWNEWPEATAIEPSSSWADPCQYLRILAEWTGTAFSEPVHPPAIQDHTLVYDDNGSTGGTTPVAPDSFYYPGATVIVPGNTGGLVKTGYTFNGWNTAADASGINYVAGGSFSINANTILYAKWNAGPFWGGAAADTLWTNAANWNTMADGSGTDSAAGETAIFNITTLNAAVTTTLNANLTMGCFVFNNTGTTQIHTDNVASRIITLGAGGITINPRAGSVQFAETNATNKKVQFVLTACQSWINNGSGTLSLTSDAAPNINVGAYRLVFGGSGNIATMGRFAGTGGYTKTGAGILTATSVSSFTGSLILEGGTWDATTFANVNTDSSIGKGSVSGSAADLVFGGGTLRHSAANVASTNRLFTIGNATGLTATIDSSAVSATNTTSFTGTDALAYGGSGARTLTLKGSNTGTNTFAPVIGDGTGGATSLVKDGTGAWTVSGASNSYTGATTILDGTLSVTAPNFADASTVTIGTSAGSPAVLNLPNAGTDNVAVLIIDGVTKAAGLYDKDNSDGAITGDGKINVGAVVPDYDTWKTANSVTGGPTADDDGDGVKNFDEYAFGLNPKSGASASPISSPLDKTTGLFKYTRRKQSLTVLTYTYESSTTLAGAWPTFTPDSATSNNGDPVEEITVDVPNTLLANPSLFIRVKAVQP